MSIEEKLKKATRRNKHTPFRCEVLKEKLNGVSAESVARYLGVVPLTVKNILRGESVSLENALKLAKLVEMPVEELWELR